MAAGPLSMTLPMALQTARPVHIRGATLVARKHGDRDNSLVLQQAWQVSSEMLPER